jgi:hypothetical protein
MRHESCDRARRWVSLALDEGLSDIETRLLRAHLARCSDCRVFEASVSSVTGTLRSADLVTLAAPITLPVRRQRFGTLRVASASAAAAAAAVAAFGVLGLVSSNEQVRSSFPSQFANVRNTEEVDVRAARRAEMITRLHPQFAHVQMARADRV